MRSDDILILKGNEITRLLDGRELEVIDAVKQAYITHAAGQSSLPHSTFLRFPDNPLNRIIALPAYLGAGLNTAGIKWVSSFPGNRELALDRASAVIILSSHTTGRPEAIIEGSIISARRTAASAALAAQHLHQGKESARIGVIGCGLISFEIARFLLASHRDIQSFLVFDIDPERAQSFKQNCAHEFPQVGVEVASSAGEVLSGASLIALATSAATPHIADLSACQPGATLLHISLRDLDPQVVLSCDNIVDDIDHVCRAQTSVHLAEQLIGNRDFIRGTLADVISGKVSPRSAPDRIVIFSPFGLGVLDLAVSVLVRRYGILSGTGTVIDSFLPDSGLIKNNGNPANDGRNMTDAAQRIAKLSPPKLGLLAERLMGEGESNSRLQPIPRHIGPPGPAPLSFAQERLWFLYRLQPESAVYNIPRAFRLTGDLNLPVLERCLTEIVRRHETLRTSFAEVEGEPEQSVGPPFTVTIPLNDLRELPETERESVARRLAAEEALQPFDLERGPVFRSQLLRLRDDEYLALFTIHHIVSDAWSAGILLGEIVTLYRAFSVDLPSSLAELPIQYADFARWQRNTLEGKRLDEMTAYWRSQLSGAKDSLKLPSDRPRPEVQDFSGARHTITLTRKLTLAIKSLSRQERTTLFTTLLTAFNILLNFYSGQEDIVVGSPIANRTRFETKGLIGFFVNTLALRTDLTGNPSFKELLARSSEVTRQAFTNQDLPFDRLVKALRPERSLSHMPLFQVVFHMNNAPKSEFALPGLHLNAVNTGALTVPFSVVVHATEVASDELLLAVEYQTALFNASTTSRLLAELVSLLEAVTSRPEATLSELREIRAETERRQKINRETELEEITRQKLATVRRRVVVENRLEG